LYRAPDNSDFRFHEMLHPRSGSIPSASQPFPGRGGLASQRPLLEQLSDTIVFALWATLMLTATLPIAQLMHRTIGCRLTSARVEHSQHHVQFLAGLSGFAAA
jgi:hypothetical protein